MEARSLGLRVHDLWRCSIEPQAGEPRVTVTLRHGGYVVG